MDLSPLSIAVAASALVATLLLLSRRLRVRLPPGPRPWPVVGNLYDIKPVRFRCFAEWARTHGPIMSVWFGTTLNVVVSSAELAREVLKEKDQSLADRPRNRASARFSRNGQDLIWADYGPHYVKVRKLCNLELFSPKRLEALRPIREDEVTAMVESIFRDCTQQDSGEKSVVVRSHLSGVAFNNITRLAFGKRFVSSEGVMDEQGLEFKAIVANGLKFGASLSLGEYVPWLRWMFPLDEEAFAKHGARRDRLTRAIMDEHTRARKEGGARQHFVDALLTLQEKYDLSEDTIIGLLWDMITAGMDTTVITVEWAMAELVKHPRVQEKVQEELDRVIGVDRVLTEADFPSLPYLQCVVKEALRLHPPTPPHAPPQGHRQRQDRRLRHPQGIRRARQRVGHRPRPCGVERPVGVPTGEVRRGEHRHQGERFSRAAVWGGAQGVPRRAAGHQPGAVHVGASAAPLQVGAAGGGEAGGGRHEREPGMVTFMHTPLQAVAVPRLPSHLYSRVPVDM